MTYSIGFDVGGTFVDLVAVELDTLSVSATKVPSFPDRQAESVEKGLRDLLILCDAAPSEVGRLVHGTTMPINSLLERRGGRVGMITSRNFRDVVDIGRMLREDLFNLRFQKPVPLAPRHLRMEVTERVDASGGVQAPLDETQVVEAVDALVAAGVDAVAVCFLHSFVNPAHELRVAELIASRHPDVRVSLSHEMSRDAGEYERWTSAAVNAYLMPQIHRYLAELQDRVRQLGIAADIDLISSNGGVIPLATAQRFPLRLLASGPAGGVAAAARFGRTSGIKDLVTFDMGGTSTDVCVVRDGRAEFSTGRTIGGFAVRTIMSDVHSVGAGGGSIASVDASGTLTVGPQGAGAEPGPAAYGLGGNRATVTDADVVLGYVNPLRYCAGRMPIDVDAARAAIARDVAAPTGTSVVEAAYGILAVAVTSMVGAIREVTTQRGYDTRDFALVAFGGGGPVHAGMVAARLDIPVVLIPAYPALLSAQGLLFAERRADQSMTVDRRLSELAPLELSGLFDELAGRCQSLLNGGTKTISFSTERLAELCFEGQVHGLLLPVAGGDLTEIEVTELGTRLDNAFQDLYGFLPSRRTPRLLSAQVLVRSTDHERELLQNLKVEERVVVERPPMERRTLYFEPNLDEPVDAAIYERSQLPSGTRLLGPCVIEEDYSTTIVYPGQSAEIDDWGNVLLFTGINRGQEDNS